MNRKIKIIVMIVITALIATFVFQSLEKETFSGIRSTVKKSYNIPTGFNFIETGKDVKKVELWQESRNIVSIKPIEVVIDGMRKKGVELPALWSGRYQLKMIIDSYTGDYIGEEHLLEIGITKAGESIEECLSYGPSAEGNACLAEFLPRYMEKIGAKGVRDELIKYSDQPLIWNCHGWLGGYAYGVLKINGFVNSLKDDYLTCKYSYLHQLVANEVLINRDLNQVLDDCIKYRFKGMPDTEALYQCMHGIGFAGVASMQKSVDEMLNLCLTLKSKAGENVSNCYEGTYRAEEMRARSYYNFYTDFKPVSFDTSKYVKMDTPDSCITKLEPFKFACYRYTIRANTKEALYAKTVDERYLFLEKWRDNLCRLESSDACWYGIADAIFALFGKPPLWSFEELPEENWGYAVKLCSLDENRFNKVCIERITHDHINKNLDRAFLSKWCEFIKERTDQQCEEKSINDYIERFIAGKSFDPQALKSSKKNL